jgi:hypothetical protein
MRAAPPREWKPLEEAVPRDVFQAEVEAWAKRIFISGGRSTRRGRFFTFKGKDPHGKRQEEEKGQDQPAQAQEAPPEESA